MSTSVVNYFIIGIKGAAMANIAAILKQQGHSVTGYDTAEQFPTDRVLEQNGISYTTDPNSFLPEKTEIVIYSAAHGGKNNPFITQAMDRDIKVQHQSEFLGELVGTYPTSVAVAGCHGKTTTSAMMAYVLLRLGENPSYMIGAPSFSGYPGSASGGNEVFIIEADEYAVDPPTDKTPKFLLMNPTHAIITNIDFDHPDVYPSLEATKKVFGEFIQKVLSLETAGHAFNRIVLCADDSNLMDVAGQLRRELYVTFGFAEKADFRITQIQTDKAGTTFSIMHQGVAYGTFTFSLFGNKNISNATGVIAMLNILGYSSEKIVEALTGFSGAKRRFEFVGQANDTYLFDDYAHHPEELKAIISAARSRFPDKRVVVIFQPHTFSRTASLLAEFGQALSQADNAIILPIFASAREQASSDSVVANDIAVAAQRVGKNNVVAAADNNLAFDLLKTVVRKGDVVLTTGAGDVYKLKDGIMEVISKLS